MSNDSDPLELYRSGSTEPWTVEVLTSLVRALRPAVVIETGTFEGRTTKALCDAMVSYSQEQGSHLFSVEGDPVRADAAEQMIFDTPIPANQYSGNFGFAIVRSDALSFLRNFEGTPDFVFLDDDHTASHVMQEVAACFRIMKSGGVICLHDVHGPFGLDRVVRDFGGVCLPLKKLHVAGGIGIVVKP